MKTRKVLLYCFMTRINIDMVVPLCTKYNEYFVLAMAKCTERNLDKLLLLNGDYDLLITEVRASAPAPALIVEGGGHTGTIGTCI